MTQKKAPLHIAWKTKRSILLCLMVLVSSILLCWHYLLVDRISSIGTRAEIRKLMNARSKHRYQYHVRGPLTLAEVEQELFGATSQSSRTRISDSAGISAWEKMKSSYRDGDEFYFVKSDARSWSRLEGWRGYVLIRGNMVVEELTTFMN
jgi:hypothetical protein